ncbi:hypothetical protein [Nocardioides marmoraquaticus]
MLAAGLLDATLGDGRHDIPDVGERAIVRDVEELEMGSTDRYVEIALDVVGNADRGPAAQSGGSPG